MSPRAPLLSPAARFVMLSRADDALTQANALNAVNPLDPLIPVLLATCTALCLRVLADDSELGR